MPENLNIKSYETPVKPSWCPGCGNHAIWVALRQALVKMKIKPWEVAFTFGIGCNSNGANFIKGYILHALHGRPLPCAEAIRWTNHKLKAVIAIGGDGDSFGIGLSHFIHACRRNVDVLYLTHDNQIYGLTTGQTSPTSVKGFKSKSTPFGNIEEPINPLALALSNGASFVARGFAGETEHLTSLIINGIKHRGFALIDVFQPCITFNHLNTFAWFRERVYKLEETNYQPTNKKLAWQKSLELGHKIPLGLFYQERKATYFDELPQLKKEALVEKSLKNINLNKALEEYQ
ncbi:2-oxoacid ferredoxin oxidoreductase [Patescibacteria group bacterium]|nr:2-oxoacid ferredoxin oxidoreductase [Patescibacteria group bacterium]